MPRSMQLTKTVGKVSIVAAGILLVVFGVGFFAVGFDQGQLFSIVEGQMAYTQMNGVGYLHEMTHDMRHASGFPCH